ncbi:hypothetical protein [Aurantiacibacter suaedae]|uniref:hypothetical protein n=1 Tax=Aurantiacibacter suaedae TaxID=2545755 RepID=UPI0010F982CD|nr:hypothetical protein [Aurantiacibacter suaedae]
MNDPEHIRAWQRLSSEITTSGMLAERNLRDLIGTRIKHVLDLTPADHPEALPGEEHGLRLLGIGYTRVEVPFAEPQEEHYAAFVRAVEGLPRPLHVHCVANHRVSAFFYRYHLECGWNEQEARALMAQQWEPGRSDHPTAAPWGQFVREARLASERRRKVRPTSSIRTQMDETDAI